VKPERDALRTVLQTFADWSIHLLQSGALTHKGNKWIGTAKAEPVARILNEIVAEGKATDGRNGLDGILQPVRTLSQ